MAQRLLMIGAGQYGRVAKEVAESMACFEEIDFLDDHNPMAVGKISDCEMLVHRYAHAFVAVGDPSFRMAMIDKLEALGYQVATLVSPLAAVSPSAQLSAGTIVEPMAVIQSHAVMGRGCLVCAGAVVKHNATVGEGCYLDCLSVVMQGASVPAKTKVHSGQAFTST